MSSRALSGCRGVRHAVMVAAALALSTSLVFGRAGYYRAPAGRVRWGRGLVLMGEPHHHLGAAQLIGGPVIPHAGRGGSFLGEAGGGSAGFIGSSIPGDSKFSSTWRATQSAPYESDARYEPWYYHNYNSYWLHGYWGGGLWGWGRWCGDIGIWSLPRWSMGPVYYPSGYGLFQNPFLDGATSLTAADQIYAFPLPTRTDAAAGAGASEKRDSTRAKNEAVLEKAREDLLRSPREIAALKKFDLSRDAFQDEDYKTALEEIEAALAMLPGDAALHEYRALILFARGDYRRAAIALYAVVSGSPGFDWTTLSGFYANQATYTAQLRKLEAYHKANPDAADAAFLLGCHYLTCRHFDSALRKMTAVAQLLPGDSLASELTVFLQGAAEFESRPVTYGPEAPEGQSTDEQSAPDVDTAKVDPAQLVGNWSANRSKDIQIDLTLTAERRFEWKATERGVAHEFSGEYTAEGDRIILVGPRGTALAQWAPVSPTRFNFKLLENDPADAGLEFVKAR